MTHRHVEADPKGVDKPLHQAFGRVLQGERQARRLSQAALSARCHVDQTYISQLERGRKSPSLRVLAAIAAALDLSLVELIGMVEQQL